MTERQIKRFQVGEVKSAIILFILENNESVSEPAIREFLKKTYDINDQGTINKHLHDLEKRECIEPVLPNKKSRSNYWDIKKLKNLRNISQEFPKIPLNMYEKSLTTILQEHRYVITSPDWLKRYNDMLASSSLFYASMENSIDTLDRGIWKLYRTIYDLPRNQRIDNLLKMCYLAYIKYHPDFKESEEKFITSMRGLPWEIYINFPATTIPNDFERYFPGLPKEIPQLFFETKLSGIEGITDDTPEEINANDIAKYALKALRLIIDQGSDFSLLKEDLLLEHFYHNDMITEAVSEYETYYVEALKLEF